MSCRHNWQTLKHLEGYLKHPTLSWCKKCGTLRTTEYKTVNHESGHHGITSWESWDYAVKGRTYAKTTEGTDNES